MEIKILNLDYTDIMPFIEHGDFSVESNYIMDVKKYSDKQTTKFYIKKVENPTKIPDEEFKKEFRIKSYLELLQEVIQRDKASFKALVNGEIAGIIIAEEEPWEKNLFIYELAVDKKFRRMGIATRLMYTLEKTAIERNVSHLMLQVDYRNYPAISFYMKSGFEITGLIFRAYSSIFMKKDITTSHKERR